MYKPYHDCPKFERAQLEHVTRSYNFSSQMYTILFASFLYLPWLYLFIISDSSILTLDLSLYSQLYTFSSSPFFALCLSYSLCLVRLSIVMIICLHSFLIFHLFFTSIYFFYSPLFHLSFFLLLFFSLFQCILFVSYLKY